MHLDTSADDALRQSCRTLWAVLPIMFHMPLAAASVHTAAAVRDSSLTCLDVLSGHAACLIWVNSFGAKRLIAVLLRTGCAALEEITGIGASLRRPVRPAPQFALAMILHPV